MSTTSKGTHLETFIADPNALQMYDCTTEASFSILPTDHRTSNMQQARLGNSHWQTFVTLFNVTLKVLLFLAAISICVLVLRQYFLDEPATSSVQNSPDYCGGNGWTAYRDETCFKLMKKWATRGDAESACRLERLPSEQLMPHLASIKSAAEQSFLTQLLFTDSALNVWIGAWRNVTNQGKGPFVWEDGSPVTYTAADLATDLSAEKNCVELHKTSTTKESYDYEMDKEVSVEGKWRLADCQQANYFVCQKPQRWPLEKLQGAFLASRRNQFPIGFIYVQLSYQSSPLELWPHLPWLDVSGNFSGTFLRVEGGAAAPFGEIQEENVSGQLQSVEYIREDGIDGKVDLGKGKCTKVRTGGNGGDLRSLQFCTRDGQLRPHNMAVKIWKRVE